MIDTVRFEFRGVIPAEGRRGFKLTERSTAANWVDEEGRDGAKVFTFIATDQETGARFLGIVNPSSVTNRYLVEEVELSVPRLVYGHNFREVPREGFQSAIETVVSYCREVAPLGEDGFGIGYLHLKRVDLVKQFRASSADLIAAHRATKHPAMRSGGCEWFGESIAWKGKERMLRMYDKLQEAGKLREPSEVTRLELETRGTALDRDLGSRAKHLKGLTFDGCYAAYRAQIMKLQPCSLPAATGWVEFLALLQRAGVRIDGVPVFEVWARTKGKSTIRRVRAQMAAVRPRYWAWDWSQALPEDAAQVVPVEPTLEELERYGVALAA